MNNAPIADLLLTLDVSNQLGEGVQWHQASQSIWWTDIESACLMRYSTVSTQVTEYAMPERVGCFAFIEGDDRMVIAFSSGIALYDLSSKELCWLAQPEKHLLGHRFNDGRVDRQGRFWAGTMIESSTENTIENTTNNTTENPVEGQLKTPASLYQVDHQQHCHTMLSDLTISNGLCWNLAGDILYHADSPTQKIYQYDMNIDTGALSNKQLFACTSENSFPDGATVDRDGFLWSAQWGGAKVVRYTPQGDVDFVLTVPVSQPSCVALGGPNMDWLIVTSAKQDLSEQQLESEPQAGHVFVYQLDGIYGVSEPCCRRFDLRK